MFWGRGQQKSSRQFDVADPPSRENARSQKDLRMGTFSDIGFEFFLWTFKITPSSQFRQTRFLKRAQSATVQ